VLDAQRMTLAAIADTPLAALVAATRLVPQPDVVSNTPTNAYTPDLDFIQDMANVRDPDDGSNQHDQAISDIAAVAIPAVRNHLNFARTVVNPLVEELGQKVGARIAAMNPTSLSGAEIRIKDVPTPFGNAALETLISRFTGVAYDSPPLTMRLPDIEDISTNKAMFQTGTASLDTDVEQWLASRGDSFIQEVWEGVFQVREVQIGQVVRKTFTDWIGDADCGAHYSLAIFLLARHLLDNIPAGTQMDLRQYEDLCADFRDQAACAIGRGIEREDQIVKNGVLVSGHDRLRVEVNSEVYRKWIENGGENEVLFGNALQPTPFVTVTEIDANARRLRKAWDQHTGLVVTVERNKRFNTIVGLLDQYFNEQISQANVETDFTASGGMELVRKRFRDELRTVTESDLENIYRLALRLICKARFPEHAAFEILSGIDRNKAQNPQLDVRECATLSTFEYVAAWIASMIRPVAR
jgi:hypothetical protein